MIGCDNPSCPIKWFHKSCLRMDSDPEGNGFVLPVTDYLSEDKYLCAIIAVN